MNNTETILDNQNDTSKSKWIFFSLLTVILWGVWGAYISKSEENGFPVELGYVMWAFSMLVPAFFMLKKINWKLDMSLPAVLYGSIIGLLGGIGQLILYTGAIKSGPAYLIFPIISLAPVVTILMSVILLKERAGKLGWLGIFLALIAVPFLNYSEPDTVEHTGWLVFSLLVFIAWGVQGYFLKFANEKVSAESIFIYMTLASLVLSPLAWSMTDNSSDINWGVDGAGLAFFIGLLNAFGALFLVFAFRYGKAIVVSPLVNCLPPIITSIISLIILSIIPNSFVITGMVIAIVSALFLSLDD